MKVGVLSFGLLAALLLGVSAHAGTGIDCSTGPDTDGDGIVDQCDNCSTLPNNGISPQPGNCDTDQDGYGNACDGDFNQSWNVTATDFNVFLPDFLAGTDSGVGSDMNCSVPYPPGQVTATDFNLFLPQFTTPGTPGPSGLACAGTVPCPTP